MSSVTILETGAPLCQRANSRHSDLGHESTLARTLLGGRYREQLRALVAIPADLLEINPRCGTPLAMMP